MSPIIGVSFRAARRNRSARGYAAIVPTPSDEPVRYTEIRALPPPPLELEAARARGAAHARQALPGLRSVRRARPPAARRLGLPEPWQGTIEASLRLIDELDREITDCERELRRLGADHRYVPLLLTVPGISWVLAYTIAAEIGDIGRFPTPRKLAGYSGLCPRVYQSGERDLRGPLAKQGPKLPALGARRGRHPRLHRTRLPRPLPADESPDRQAARRQGRPDRPRAPTLRGDLAHAHPRPTLRSQRRHRPPGRLRSLDRLTQCAALELFEADQAAGDREEGFVDVGSSFVADAEPPVLVEPGDRALDDPALLAEA